MKAILIAVLAAFLLFGCAGYGAGQQAPAGGASAPNGAGQPSLNPNTGATAGVAFSGSQYAATAVEVYPGTTSGSSSAEVQGFDMAPSPQADGSVMITMTEKAGGQTLKATVPKGGKLYFNDANPGDDATGQDKFLQDDKLIAVDSNGYIVPG